MNELTDIKKWYLSNFEAFEQSLNGSGSKPFHNIRKDAIESFTQLDFPTVKDEEWKYTNITPVLKHNFKPADKKVSVTKEDVDNFNFHSMNCCLLVFVNGIFVQELSSFSSLPKGVIVQNLAKAIEDNHPAVEKHFGKYADYKSHIFTSLSTAFTKEGAFIYVPDGKIVEEPVHILFISSAKDEKILSQPRNLFIAGKNSQVSIIEHYVCLSGKQGEPGKDVYFTNSVTEVVVDENGIMDHVKLQEESKKAFHISRMEVDQERSSNFASHMLSLGGEIARNDFNTRFNGEGGESTLNGLFLIDGNQLFDAHTMIDHAMPHCNSHEHYKGILDNVSRGVFNGKVMVRKDAQKTNAFQENNNIILSNEALVNTKPQLEIFADDVKCSHGATIGQLDEDAMFYLKSRGIGGEAGRAILIHAFASDVVKSIKIEPVKNYIEEILTNKFNS
ncbi:MAG: Fe-S cluster assembly protein SufD [Ignavibacteriaceae bacterium]